MKFTTWRMDSLLLPGIRVEMVGRRRRMVEVSGVNEDDNSVVGHGSLDPDTLGESADTPRGLVLEVMRRRVAKGGDVA